MNWLEIHISGFVSRKLGKSPVDKTFISGGACSNQASSAALDLSSPLTEKRKGHFGWDSFYE